MKVCQRGWEYAQIFGKEGTVGICCWASMNYKPIGKLTEKSLYEVWHGKEAEEFRESLLDGSYRFCEKEKCPWMANGTLESHMKEYEDVIEYPKEIALAFERNCNYNCTCCSDKDNKEGAGKEAAEMRRKIEEELSKCLNQATTISANGRGELFASPHILKLLHDWEPEASKDQIHVILETNGSLFDKKHWEQIQNLGQYDLKVSVTVMGFQEATYQFLSGTTLPVSNIKKNLHFIERLRDEGIVNCFEIGTVIQERNFREMPEFTKCCIEEFHADIVRLRPYFPFGDIEPSWKWFYDIRNVKHPYYQEYVEVMKHSIFKDPHVMMWSGSELSQQGVNPYQKDKMNFDVIKYFAADENIVERLRTYFWKKKIEKVALYGFGYIGTAFANLILKWGIIRLDAILDQNKKGEFYKGYVITDLAHYEIKEDTPIIITTPYYYDEVRTQISHANHGAKMFDVQEIISEIE